MIVSKFYVPTFNTFPRYKPSKNVMVLQVRKLAYKIIFFGFLKKPSRGMLLGRCMQSLIKLAWSESVLNRGNKKSYEEAEAGLVVFSEKTKTPGFFTKNWKNHEKTNEFWFLLVLTVFFLLVFNIFLVHIHQFFIHLKDKVL